MLNRKLQNFKFFCQRGFSILEVLIASSIALIVIFGVLELVNFTFQSQKSLMTKDSFRGLAANVGQILTNQVACTNTFSGVNPTSAPPGNVKLNIYDKLGSVVYNTTSTYMNGTVQFTEFELVNYNSGTSLTDLNIKAKKIGPAVGGEKMLATITLLLVLNSSNQIVSCRAVGDSLSIWKYAANGTDIYYNDGNVGIGVLTPTVSLDSNGPIRPGVKTEGTACSASEIGSLAIDGATKKLLLCK